MNPYLASMLEEQQTQRAKSAYESLTEGEQQLDRLINRSTTLQAPGRAATQAALQAKALAPKPSVASTLLRGASGLLRDPKAQREIWDLLRKGVGLFSGGGTWGNNPEY